MATFSKSQRTDLAAKGIAEPDGSYPIRNATDLRNAINDCNRTGQKPSDVAHIIARAKALGLSSMIPDSWVSKDMNKMMASGMTTESARTNAKGS